MKQLASKSELRAEIERQVRDFLHHGGAVEEVARGVSGRDPQQGPSSGFHRFAPRPREERTYLPVVVAAIEARRRKPKDNTSATRTRTHLVRKAVYDDFGEPLRWEWVEEEVTPQRRSRSSPQ